jgi:hypothetical protein
MSASKHASVHERWAHLRFAVVGQLLAAPSGPRVEVRVYYASSSFHDIVGGGNYLERSQGI